MKVARERRLDIDILRALAVLAVCLYHFDAPGFDGGFLGVDVFFVISGYLITLHIRQELAKDTFSFLRFYTRRIRRLVPALLTVAIVTAVAGAFILPRPLFTDAIESTVAAILYVSNIHFWSISNYFDTDAVLKPLLHTWSLGVEEQFYLFWPIFLFLIPHKRAWIAVLIAGIVSLAAAEIFFDFAPSAVFYLFPFRVFEFAFGAILACITLPRISALLSGLVGLMSLAVMAASFLLVTETTPNPGFVSLPVCAATAAIIAFRPAWMNADVLPIQVLTRIGLVSYSAYLVHWPLVVYYKVINPGDLDAFEIIGHLATTYVLAELLYLFVEKPTQRLSIENRKAVWIGAPVAAGGMAFATLLATPLIYRAPPAEQMTVAQLLDSIPPRQEVLEQSRTDLEAAGLNRPQNPYKTILVVGDSHAGDLRLALLHSIQEMNISVRVLQNACDPLTARSLTIPVSEHYANHPHPHTQRPGYCESAHDAFLQRIQNVAPDVIVFGEFWRHETLPFLADTIRELRRDTDAEIIVLGRNPTFRPNPAVLFRDVADASELNAEAFERRTRPALSDAIDENLESIAMEVGVTYISRLDLVCQETTCDIFDGSAITYLDGTHWSRAGFELFGRRLWEHPDFASVVE